MRAKQIAIAIAISLPMGACVETNIQGYADLQAPSTTIRHLAAFVAAPPNLVPGILASIRSEAGHRGLTADDIQTFLPPTRQYTPDEVKQALASQGVDAVLVISMGDSGIQNQYIGTFISGNSTSTFNGTATAVSNGPFTNVGLSGTTNTSGFATATPIYRPSRATRFDARLIEAKTGRALWVGQGQTNSSGLLFVGQNDSKSIASIFDDLQIKHILPPNAA